MRLIHKRNFVSRHLLPSCSAPFYFGSIFMTSCVVIETKLELNDLGLTLNPFFK